MAAISQSFDAATGITHFRIEGDLVTGELLAYLRQSPPDSGGRYRLFDFRQARWRLESLDQFRRNFIDSGTLGVSPRFTAYLFSSQEDFGLGRMMSNLSELMELTFTAEAFLDYDKALAWLQARQAEAQD